MKHSNSQPNRPTFVSGGAPGLGKRSSRWFDPWKLRDHDSPEDEEDETDAVDVDMGTLDPIEMIDALLKHQAHLNAVELEWVQRIDRTVADFDGDTELTPRQRVVISNIFARYRKR